MAWAEVYLHAKLHLDPSSRLATIYNVTEYRQTGRQDRQTGQRSHSIGRTVLQTVAQKLVGKFFGDLNRAKYVVITCASEHGNVFHVSRGNIVFV